MFLSIFMESLNDISALPVFTKTDSMHRIIPCLLMATVLTFSLYGQLPRRAFLGTLLYTVNDSIAMAHNLPQTHGALVGTVIENSSAQAIGLQPGDLIVSVLDNEVFTNQDVIQAIARHREGDTLSFTFLRNGRLHQSKAMLRGFPKEISEYAEVIYDAVPYGGGYVRSIIHRPEGEGPFPAFFYIQGAHCGSMDNMDGRWPVARMLEGIVRKGYVVIKTEKAGVGDSKNDIHCKDCDLLYEVGLFSASYNQLGKYDFIDTENIFVFGHSMGGVQAPMLETDLPPKGIAVFGTVVRPWFEYYLDIVRKQRLMLGQDYLENEANHEKALRFFYNLMVEKKSPEEMENDVMISDFMHNQWNYDGAGRFHGRHYAFWQQLQDTRLFAAWAGTPAYVLSVWGEGEFVALNPYEHQLIAEIVNHYNPGKARFVSMPNIDHGFVRVDDVEHAIAIRSDWDYQYNNFNPLIVEMLHQWMQEVITQ